MANFLDEYLIRLGSYVDQSGMARFQSALRDASAAVDRTAGSMAKSFLGVQAEIVSGFAAIGGAAIGVADHVAMADQEFRLFGLHMYMSKNAARDLKMTMDALGQPLENLAWDPELRQRAARLIGLQREMAPTGDFNAQMYKLRSIRTEFSAMEIEVQYLAMHVVQDFLNALGTGPDRLLARLRSFNDWVATHLPEISHMVVERFLPVWRDVKEVMWSTAQAIEQAGILFTNLVGLFSGDTSIEGTTLHLKNLFKAVGDVTGGFAAFATLIAHLETMLAHFVNALVLLSERKFSAAGKEFKAAGKSITTAEGIEALGGAFGFITAGPLGALAGAGAGHEFAMAAGQTSMNQAGPRYQRGMALGALQVAQRASSMLGIPADLLWSQMAFETGGFKKFAGLNNLAGIKDPTTGEFKNYTSLEGFLHDYERVLSLPRYAGAKNASDAASFVGGLHAGGYFGKDDPRAYLSGVRHYDSMYKSGDVHIGAMTIHVDKPNAVNEDVANAVIAKLRAQQGKATQRAQLHFQSLGVAQ